jgi:hypothetical protein
MKTTAAEAAVPAELRDTYADLLHDYTTAARSHGDTSVPNFAILVDLVRNGWRKAPGSYRHWTNRPADYVEDVRSASARHAVWQRSSVRGLDERVAYATY